MNFKNAVESVVADVVFFQDSLNDDALFAEFTMGSGVTYFDRLESSKFKTFIRMKSLDIIGREEPLNADAAIQYIRDYFIYEEDAEKVDIYIRTVGNLKDGIEYSLKDKKQNVVLVDKEGWKLSTQTVHKFLHSSVSKAQVVPKRCEESPLKLLKPFVNLNGDDFILFVVWLIQAFCTGNHFALLVTAERGSGKSTISRIARMIIEPSGVDISHLSNKKEELLNTLSNLYLVCFDNVRNISQEQSDLLCSAITKGTATKRALYTDNDMYVQKLHNAVLINGISVYPKESDLAERFLIVNLKKLTPDKIRREKEFWDSFNNKLPYILGSIFNTLSKAMRYFETLSLQNMPRMADAFADMVAIALALGVSEDEFRAIYDNNVVKMNRLRSETPLVKAANDLITSLNGKRAIEDTAEKILELLKNNYTGDVSDLPVDGSHLSRLVDMEHQSLSDAGLRINIDDTFSDATRIKIIKKKSKKNKK